MPHQDDMLPLRRGDPGSADDVGIVHMGRYGDRVLDVETPKPPPHWLTKLRSLARRGERSGARPR